MPHIAKIWKGYDFCTDLLTYIKSFYSTVMGYSCNNSTSGTEYPEIEVNLGSIEFKASLIYMSQNIKG